MFMSILALGMDQTYSTSSGNFNIQAYDCSAPRDIKVFDAEARCSSDSELPGDETTVQIVQLVENEELRGYKCRITCHRKAYYCGLFSYSKPILSAEREETLMVSAATCGEMARTRTFITPQTRTSETLVVPGRTYIMEFEAGMQTASNSVIKCQGEAVLMNGSIQKGVVQHTEFQITIEEEIFQKRQDKVLAMSSSEILSCNPHGPASGCVGALHSYTWDPPESTCDFKIVRAVTGMINSQYFVADAGQLFYELRGSQNLPLTCGGSKATATNVDNIFLLTEETKLNKQLLVDIKPQDVSNAAELRSLALYLRYKLELAEGKRSAIGTKMSCLVQVQEPADAPPHHLGDGVFVFKRGEVMYQYSCEQTMIKLMDKDTCFSDVPIQAFKQYNFVSLANRMLLTTSTSVPCTPNFAVAVKGVDGWIRVGPGLRTIPPPRKESRTSVNFTHPDDELGLYTAAEEADFDHVAGLRGYTNLVTSSIVHAVCRGDSSCDLKELPGGPSYSLTKLENEMHDLTSLGGFEYFVKKFCEPLMQGLHYFAAAGGFVTSCQWVFWLLKLLKNTLKACCRSTKPIHMGADLTEATLMELMGDSRQAPHNEPYRQGSAAHRRGYPPIMRFSRAEKEDMCEMTSDPIVRK